jgi:hypothetical protein
MEEKNYPKRKEGQHVKISTIKSTVKNEFGVLGFEK